MADPKKATESLGALWATHNHKDPLYVSLDGKRFHVKHKNKFGGFLLEDSFGLTMLVNDTASKPIWKKDFSTNLS